MKFSKCFLTRVFVMVIAFAVCTVYNVNFSQVAMAQDGEDKVSKTTEDKPKDGNKAKEDDGGKEGKKEVAKDESAKKESAKKEEGTKKVDNAKEDPKPSVSVSKVEKKDSWDKADKWIGRITDLLSGLFYLVLMVLGWVGKNEWIKSKRLQKILGYADDVFEYVEKLAKKTDWKGDDKLVKFLEKINDMLKVDGDKPLDTNEVERLKIEAEKKAKKSKSEDGKGSSGEKTDG